MTSLAVGVLIGLVVGVIVGAAWAKVGRRPRPREAAAPPSDDPDLTPRRSELVSKIAHELKNPVMAVKGLASTGSRLYDSLRDEERRDLFRLIDTETDRLRLIAEETSTALKIDAGTLVYDRREQDVGRLVEETAWRTPVGDHPVEVTSQAGMLAPVDGARLAEALSYLIDNAAKFSPAGSAIEVRAARAQGGIGVEIVDAGPGIPDERKASAFDRYGTWRPPGYEEVAGAGLGLSIALAHVAAHHGRLELEDAHPHGTVVRVWLPSRDEA